MRTAKCGPVGKVSSDLNPDPKSISVVKHDLALLPIGARPVRRVKRPARRRGAAAARLALFLALIVLLVIAHDRSARAACAANFCWNVPSGSWFTGTNWTPTGPPTSADTVNISNGGTDTIDNTNAQSSNAVIDSNSTVEVVSGGSWNNDGNAPGFNRRGGAIIVGETGTGGALTIDNGGTVTTSGTIAGSVLIGDQSGSSGTITLGNGGVGTASLTNNGPAGYPGNFYVGYGGSGTLNVNAGGTLSGFDGMTLGVLTGSSGAVTVDAGSLDVSNTGGGMTIGSKGLGTLTVENGGIVTAGNFAVIADSAGSNGSSAMVTGTGSTWNIGGGGLIVGDGDNGSLTIASGGTVSLASGTPQIYVGDNNAGTSGAGTLTVDGGTLSSAEASIGIGVIGTASSSMLIENGGQVTTTDGATLGDALFGESGTGSVTVTGTGSSWNIGSQFLEINNAGTGTALTISNGGSVTSGEALIGWYESGPGNDAVVVTGTGSLWQSGVILLGNTEDIGAGTGTGTLSVSSGGHVAASGNVDIGYSPDGGGGFTDTITVDGSGSQLTTTANLRVGFYGTGALVVSNGGKVSDVEGDIAYSSTDATGAATQFGATTPTDSVGSATVTGAGSVWQNTTLIVGDNTASPGPGYGTGTSTGTLTVADGGEVTSTNAITVAANAGATGTINIGAAAGQTAVAPGTISAPAIMFGSGTGSIVFNHTGTDYVFGIPIEGAGSVDVESGVTALTATNTYAGATTVNGGTLEVDGSIADTSGVTVNAGGTLSGTGTVDPATTMIANGGTLAPGSLAAPTGTLTIGGNLALQSAAIYMISISGTNAGNTAVGGMATLGGASVDIAGGSTIAAGHKYTILTASGGVSGTFDPTVDYGFYIGTLSYDADDVYLTLNFQSLASLLPPGAPVNVINVANAINTGLNSGVTPPAGFTNLFNLSPAQLENALTQLSGEAGTDADKGSFQLMTDFLDIMLDMSVGGRGDGGGGANSFAPDRPASFPSDVALAYNSVLKAAPAASFDRRWSAWGAGFGGYNKTNGDPATGSNTVTARDYGFAAGMDYRYSADTVLGFALAGGGTNWGLAQGLGGGRSDAFQAGAYGTTHFGPAYLSAALAFANNWMTTNRNAFGDQLDASFDAQGYGARLETGYRYGMRAMGTMGIIPYAALQSQLFHMPAYSETDLGGGGFALSYNAMNATDTRSELGARLDNATLLDGMPLTLRARRLGPRLGEQSRARRRFPDAAGRKLRRQRRRAAKGFRAHHARCGIARHAGAFRAGQIRRPIRQWVADLWRHRSRALRLVMRRPSSKPRRPITRHHRAGIVGEAAIG